MKQSRRRAAGSWVLGRGFCVGLVVALGVGLGACGEDQSAPLPPSDDADAAGPTIESTTTVSPVAPSHGSEAPETPAAQFAAQIDDAPMDRMHSSWRPGCPVDPSELRLLTVSFWGFDGAAHTGELVAHERHAQDLVGVFRTLYEERFPIRRMVLVDEYDGDDDRSMAADNTSGFNCRTVAGSDTWSQHARGLAVDINPCENPYVQAGGRVSPPECAGYTDRTRAEPGMIQPGDVVVAAFAAIGWEWGGDWSDPDYQHFAPPRA